MKAFLVNRVGDFGFILGIGLIAAYTGSLNYTEIFAKAPELAQIEFPWYIFGCMQLTSQDGYHNIVDHRTFARTTRTDQHDQRQLRKFDEHAIRFSSANGLSQNRLSLAPSNPLPRGGQGCWNNCR
jgi:hypothetical protein